MKNESVLVPATALVWSSFVAYGIYADIIFPGIYRGYYFVDRWGRNAR